MSVNLVDLVMKQVGGNVPGILGSLLGESADRTQGALAGAVPAILGGLMGAVSKGGDTVDQLSSAIGQQDDSLLDNLTDVLGGGQHQQIAEQGSSMLTSLLGDGVIGTLVGAVGKFSGLGGGSTKSLLGMLVPIVMSVLGRQKKEQGLDSGGLVNLLMSQKEHVENALPAGMASALGGGNLLDSLMGGAQSATETISEAVETTVGAAGKVTGAAAVSGAAEAVGETAQRAATATADTARQGGAAISRTASDASAAATGAAESGGSWLRWLLPLVILLALLWFAFKFLGGDADVDETVSDAGTAVESAVDATTDAAGDAADAVADAAGDAADAAGDAVDATTDAAGDAADTASDAASDATDAASSAASDAAESVTAMVGDIDVGGELTSAFETMTGTLSNITDQASAEAAVPDLESMSSSLDKLTDLAGQLPEEAVGGISELVENGLSGIDGVMDSLKDIPGVGDLIEPIIAQIKEKLAAFTAA